MSYESSQRFLLKALHEVGSDLAGQFYGLAAGELDARDRDGWSLRQVLCHLRDAEAQFLDQVEGILHERAAREPVLRCVNLDLLVVERDYDSADMGETLGEYRWLRTRSCYALADAWGTDWERTGRHPYRGSLTLAEIVREMNEHDLEHVWQVRRIRDGALRR
ncbi:MAG: hypothetical protein GEU28_07390 [Dehalococcoidia bacterium]|nr:hypothetical protein [Dehalococcoidia bacterium]